jgi:hypothetical protein
MTRSNATLKSVSNTQTESRKPATTTAATTIQTTTSPAPNARARAHSASNQNGATRRPHFGHRNFGYIYCQLTFALSGAPLRTQTKDALLIGASALERVVRRQYLIHSSSPFPWGCFMAWTMSETMNAAKPSIATLKQNEIENQIQAFASSLCGIAPKTPRINEGMRTQRA